MTPTEDDSRRRALLAEADRVVAGLSAGKRETVREIVIDATRRGFVSASARRFLDTASGTSLLADVLAAALSEQNIGQGILTRTETTTP